MRKKVLASVLVVCVVFGAGSALAQQVKHDKRNYPQQSQNQQQLHHPELANRNGDNEHMNQQQPNRPDFDRFDRRGPQGPCGFEGRDNMFGHRGPMFAPDMPKEIRAKAVEIAKLRIDLEEAMSDNPVNKAKALEVHAKIQKLETEVEAWRFEKMLDRIEEVRKQHELNKKVPPAPKAPVEKPEPVEAN